MLEVAKVTAAIDGVHKELNAVIDTAVKNKQYTVLNTLNHASKALSLVESHVKNAAQRTAPKEKKAATAKK